jgi:hypothetical protein
VELIKSAISSSDTFKKELKNVNGLFLLTKIVNICLGKESRKSNKIFMHIHISVD